MLAGATPCQSRFPTSAQSPRRFVYKPQRALTQPCDLSIDLDETLFGFGRELGAGLDVATTG